MLRRNPIVVLLAAIGLITGVAVGVYYFYSKGKQAHQGAQGFAIPVVASRVAGDALINDIYAIGTLKSNESASIRPEVAGRITRIYFTEGQQVTKNDLLVEIDDAIVRAELAQAEANYNLSRITYDRVQALQLKGASSIQTKDEAQGRLKEAQAALELAKVRVVKTRITAPFSGLIGLRDVSEGDYVEIGKPLTTLESIQPMKVDFSVPEKYFATLTLDRPVSLRVDAYPDETFRGRVFAISPRVDEDTRTVQVRAEVDNHEGKLRPGMFAYVTLEVTQKEKALLVPEEALIPRGSTFTVFKVVDGKALSVPVTIGNRKGARAEVIKGLEEGDTVITAGYMKVHDGVPVQVQWAKENEEYERE